MYILVHLHKTKQAVSDQVDHFPDAQGFLYGKTPVGHLSTP